MRIGLTGVEVDVKARVDKVDSALATWAGVVNAAAFFWCGRSPLGFQMVRAGKIGETFSLLRHGTGWRLAQTLKESLLFLH